MSRHQIQTDTDPREAAGQWVGGLIEQGLSEYQAFEVLADIDQSKGEATLIRKALCAITDVLITEELPAAKAVRETANRIVRQPLEKAACLFERWAACLCAVQPNRGRMSDVCANFDKWLENLPQNFQEESLALMPEWLGAHGKACLAWLPALADCAEKQASQDKRSQMIQLAKVYIPAVPTESAAHTIEVFAELIKIMPGVDIDAFRQACPAEAIFHDGEAADFLEQFVGVFPRLAQHLRIPFVKLMIELAGQSFSSACYLACRLPACLDTLPEQKRADYLVCFKRIVACAGIAANSFVFKTLPKKMIDLQEETIKHMIDTAEAIGLNYGKSAVMRFVESLS